MFSLTKMVGSIALVYTESSIESFINSGVSVECMEQCSLREEGSEPQERRELTLSVTLGMDAKTVAS